MAPLDPRDPNAWAELARQWQQTQSAWADWWGRAMGLAQGGEPLPLPAATRAPPDATSCAASAIADLNARFQSRMQALWRAALDLQATGGRLPELVHPLPGDRRFRAAAWGDHPFFALLKQSYLLYADYLRELAHLAPLPPTEKRRLEFATRQYLDAIAPTNFAATNPDVLVRAVATEGASLVQGLRNLADDAQKGRISMTDEKAFAAGRNLAGPPGRW